MEACRAAAKQKLLSLACDSTKGYPREGMLQNRANNQVDVMSVAIGSCMADLVSDATDVTIKYLANLVATRAARRLSRQRMEVEGRQP